MAGGRQRFPSYRDRRTRTGVPAVGPGGGEARRREILQRLVQMSAQPTPRELLIALHADRRLGRRELGRLAGEVVGWARAPFAAGRPLPLTRGRAASPAPAWSTPGGAIEVAAATAATAAALGARVVTLLDPEYPPSLAAIALPPPVLIVRGQLPPGPAVALVGSRLGDLYGREVARRFAQCLAAVGVTIVSGLARGIDAAAHEGALAAPAGCTLAVLGCGMGVDYPRGHARLAAAIVARGALVSEFPCGAGPRGWHFPVRNRMIAALAAVTLVVQATPRSGSLSTARHARDLGRPVFAVPGPVFEPLSWGPHSLLRRGALLAGHPEDVLEALAACSGDAPPSVEGTPAAGAAPATALAAAVLGALGPRAARTAERVAARAGASPDAVLQALLELEVAGRVERLPGMAYRLAKAPGERRAAPDAETRRRDEP
jgi:DNA processing protein